MFLSVHAQQSGPRGYAPPPLAVVHRVLALSVCLAAALATRAPASQLVKYQKIYTSSTKRIEAGHLRRLAEGDKAYAAAVGGVVASTRKAGDLEGLLAARAEKERFEEEHKVPEADSASLHTALVQARLQHRKAVGESGRIRDKESQELLSMYATRLEALKKEHVLANQIQDALAVKTELDKILFARMELEARVDSPPPPAQPGKPQRIAPPRKITKFNLPVGAPLRSGLVAWYSFDSDGGEEESDRSGRRNNGILGSTRELEAVAPKWVPDGRVAGARLFDGNKSGILLGPRFNVRARTISLWFAVPPNSRPAWWTLICGVNTRSGEQWRLVFDPSDGGKLCFERKNGNQWLWGVKSNDGPWSDGAWYHVAAVIHPQNGTCLYVNAVRQDDRNTFDDALITVQELVTLGRRPTPVQRDEFQGRIDEVMIFERALSDAEIVSLYRFGQ